MKLITDGTDLSGGAMPRILSEFQSAVVGKRILAAGYVQLEEGAFPVLKLEDGTVVLAAKDDAHNGPGVLSVAGTSELPNGTSLCRTHVLYRPSPDA